MINIEPCCGRTLHCGARTMNATNVIEGFSVRPGLFLTNGAVVVPGRRQLHHSLGRRDKLRALSVPPHGAGALCRAAVSRAVPHR